MAHVLEEISQVTDAELVSRLECLVRGDRALGVKLLVHLGELYERKLYLARGYSSIYAYCMNELRMSGDEAYFRIRAARVARQFPLVLERLGSGAVHLSGIKLLAPYLTAENHVRLLDLVDGKTKKEIEALIAEMNPQPDAPARLRKLPTQRALVEAVQPPTTVQQQPNPPAESQSPAAATFSLKAPPAPAAFALQSPSVKAFTKALSPGRFKLEVTLGQDAHDKLEQLRELLRHQNPSGELASIVERALSELLEREMNRRFARSKRSQTRVAMEPTRPGTAADFSAQQVASAMVGTGSEVPQPLVAPAMDSSEVGADVAAREAKGMRRDRGASKTRQASRYVPRAVVREVYARDGGRCTFVSSDGRRCSATGFLEVHHHDAFARGGAQTADNLRLACRAHNLFLAERDYGRAFMQRKLRAAGSL